MSSINEISVNGPTNIDTATEYTVKNEIINTDYKRIDHNPLFIPKPSKTVRHWEEKRFDIKTLEGEFTVKLWSTSENKKLVSNNGETCVQNIKREVTEALLETRTPIIDHEVDENDLMNMLQPVENDCMQLQLKPLNEGNADESVFTSTHFGNGSAPDNQRTIG